ncbi:MAG TPA: hypothetical protein VMF61_16565 [Candidatus Acidoferrales bacterium]|nr:hypothetical protein [Candidatus Acidoferrales bacterium]
MTTTEIGALVLDILVGIGVLLFGVGIFIGMRAFAATMGRLNVTLDGVDRQLENLGSPVADTLSHVDGIAGTADQTLARLAGVVGSLEGVADSVTQTADLTKNALSPAIVNFGATLSGVSAGLRRLVTGKNSTDQA